MLIYLNKTKFLPVFILIILLISCFNIIENKKFSQISKDFLNQYFKFYPVEATLMGYHDYDHQLNNFSKENIDKLVRYFHSTAEKIATIDTSKLSPHNKINYQILSSQLVIQLFELEQWKRWQSDAIFYTQIIYNAVHGLRFHTKDTTENVTRNLISRLDQVPNLLSQAKKNLQPADIINLNTAIEQIDNQKRIIAFLLPDNFTVTNLLIDTLNKKSEIVVDSLESFRRFLESKSKTSSNKTLAMTPEMYKTYISLLCGKKINLDELINLIEADYQKYYEEILKITNTFLGEGNKVNDFIKNNKSIEELNDKIEKQSLNKDEIISFCFENVNDIKRFMGEIWNLSLPTDYNIQFDWAEDNHVMNLKLAEFENPGLLQPVFQFYCSLKPISNDRDWIQQLSELREYHKLAVKLTMMLEGNPIHYQVWIEKLDEIPILARAFPDQIFVNAWQYYFASSMLDAGFSGYDLELQYTYLRNYLKVLLLAKVEIQYYLQDITYLQLQQILLDSKFFKKNEIDEVFDLINFSPGHSFSIYWGVNQFKELEQTCRAEIGPLFNTNEYFQHLLNQGPIPIEFIKYELIHKYY